MKKLIIIAGPPGVGKTTISKSMFETIDGCAWLDADWCWNTNPWIAKSDDEKRIIEGTFVRILDTYIHNENINTIIFNWVIKTNWMFDLIINNIDCKNLMIKKIVLVSDQDSHINRLKSDSRRNELIENPEDMESYKRLDAIIVDTTHDSIEENTNKIMKIINEAQ